MSNCSDCRFSESHEWFRVSGDVVTMGITKYAANELTDITYAEMKPAGTKLNPGASIGEVESVKTTSDIYTAVGGTILNSDPYDKGWLVKIKTADASPISKLMDQATYDRKHPAD